MADRPAWIRSRLMPSIRRKQVGAAAVAILFMVPAADAGPAVERVKGFFCNDRSDQIAFLSLKAEGENEEMAANAVNKSIAKFSCAYFIPATAVHTGDQTVIEDGIVFKLRSYLFLPEKVERWTGSAIGSLQTNGPSRADI
jgi:hypothetical protein